MTRTARWIGVGLIVVAGLGAAAAYSGIWSNATAAGMAPDNAAVVALGRQVYIDNCAACHGANLEGQADWRQRRPDGRLSAPPHDAGGHTWHHPGEQLFAVTKYGPAALAGGGYQSDMAGYEGILSDAEIWAVLSFIKSRWPAEIRARHDQISR